MQLPLYLLSFILLRIDLPQEYNTDNTSSNIIYQVIKDMKIGVKRITGDKKLMRIVFAKASWNIAGGGLAGVLGIDGSRYSWFWAISWFWTFLPC